MIKSVAIEITNRSFLPEAYAYYDMFRNEGVHCEFVERGSPEALKHDAIILFHGLHPFWKSYPRIIISEYHTLSVGRFSRVKDILKRTLNVRGQYHIFLNDFVRQKMWFSPGKGIALRGMGFWPTVPNTINFFTKDFDVVYCGTFRSGLSEQILKLAYLDLKIAVVGLDERIEHKNVTNFGKVLPEETQGIVVRAKFGLNYTPDVFPFNIQDSTKVIEYCGAGLGVITNNYLWVNEFERCREGNFLNIEDIVTRDDVDNFNFVIPDVSDLTWPAICKKLYKSLNEVFSFSSEYNQ